MITIIAFFIGIIIGAIGSWLVFRSNPDLRKQADAAATELEKKMKGEK